MEHRRLARSLETLVDEWGPIKGRTRLLKLVYLADREWYQRTGEVYTEAKYYRWNHGPFSKEALEALDWMDGVEVVERGYAFQGGYVYEYASGQSTRLHKVELSPRFRSMLDTHAQRWSKRPLQELLDYVYSRNDFESTEFGEPLFD